MKFGILAITTFVIFCNNSIASDLKIFPKGPVDCKIQKNANTNVASILESNIKSDGQDIFIELLWQIGECSEIKERKGHLAKTFNTVTINQIDHVGRTIGLSIKTKELGKYALTEIQMPLTALEDGDLFKIKLKNFFTQYTYFIQIVKNESLTGKTSFTLKTK